MCQLTFSGFRDGGADDARDGQTVFRLRNERGVFVYWETGVNRVEVSSVLVRHTDKAVTAELTFNDDDSLFVEVTLGVLVGLAPSEIGAFLLAQNFSEL